MRNGFDSKGVSRVSMQNLLACALRMMESGMTTSAAINMMTLNPARHLGFDREVGRIDLSKRADLVAFHPRFGYADVIRVWVAGQERLLAPTTEAREHTFSETGADEEVADFASPGFYL